MFKKIFRFYYEGFRSMTIGKKLWTLIIIKLIIIFAVLKVFFFPDYIGERCGNDRESASHVRTELLDNYRNYQSENIKFHDQLNI